MSSKKSGSGHGHTSTVQRTVSKFDTTGHVKKKSYSSQNKMKPVQLTILQLVLSKPDMYLWEMKQELKFLMFVCPDAFTSNK